MISIRTAFVLGAGASCPYGFPAGLSLLAKVVSYARCPPTHDEGILKRMFRNKADAFADALAKSGDASVDVFLAHNPRFLEVGKAAIARVLIPCENEAALFEPTNDRQNWYKYLWQHMNAKFEDLPYNEVSFVTFNYDRSLEHFLCTAMENKYGRTQADCAAVLSRIPIVHVHGQLAAMPWQNGPSKKRPYDTALSPEAIKDAAQSIKIVSEKAEGDPEFRQAFDVLVAAEKIVLLGFGYLEENIRNLRLVHAITHSTQPKTTGCRAVFGSAFHLKDAEQAAAKRRVRGHIQQFGMETEDALTFLRHWVDLDSL